MGDWVIGDQVRAAGRDCWDIYNDDMYGDYDHDEDDEDDEEDDDD